VADRAARRDALDGSRFARVDGSTAGLQAGRVLLALAAFLLVLVLAPGAAPASPPLTNGGLAGPAIVGGGGISASLAPWEVEVEEVIPAAGGGESTVFICGGSILSTTTVLTAAHCVFNESKQVPAADMVVTAGTSDFMKAEPEAQQVKVSEILAHPDYAPNPSATEDIPDDVAVLNLEQPLVFGPAISLIQIAPAGSAPPEGTAVDVAGFGEENPLTEELNGALNSLQMNLVSTHECGGEADAVFLCARTAKGSVCFGDSGSGLTVPGSPALPGGAPAQPTQLVGVTDTVEEKCRDGALGGFASVTAPEIRDFIEGDEKPPLAPRGGGSKISGTAQAGHQLTCEPGSWSGSPSFTFTFINSANGQILQNGSSSTYALSGVDVGRTILCEVQAANAGGTGSSRTDATSPIASAPVIPAPQVASVTPSSGPAAGGTAVKIKGKGFLAGATVTIGAAAVEAKFISSSELTAKTAAGSGSPEVVVNDQGGTSKGGPTFTYVVAPTVASITPESGPATGGTAVKIKGSGFISGATVTIGTAATEVKFVSSSELTAKTPVGSGTQKVVVTDQGGTSKSGPAFTYTAPPPAGLPTVESITPNTGPVSGGTAVAIKGSGFVSGATVTIGAAASEVKFISSSELTAKTPAGSGAREVIVTDQGGTSKPGPTFTYVSTPPVASPSVESIAPDSGPAAGGTAVKITGKGFLEGATVMIGASAAVEVKFVSSNELAAKTPAGSGAREVIVTDRAGTSKGGPTFMYTAVPTTPPSPGPPEVALSTVPVLGAGTSLPPIGGATPPHVEGTTGTPSNAALVGATIAVQSGSTASVKVACRGAATCRGQLTLTAKSTVEFKGKPTLRTVPIGSASFSILGGGSKTVKVKLGPVGRSLLVSDHGRLSARLAIVKVEPAPRQSQVKVVQLVAQKVRGSAR
jgi:hypothetical protein